MYQNYLKIKVIYGIQQNSLFSQQKLNHVIHQLMQAIKIMLKDVMIAFTFYRYFFYLIYSFTIAIIVE